MNAEQQGLPITGQKHRAVTYVGLHMSHHASASGYDQLANAHPSDAFIAADSPLVGGQGALARAFAGVAARSGNHWYSRRSLNTEISSLRVLLRQRDHVLHYLYGENNFRYTGSFRSLFARRGNKVVATYHTPQARLRELILKPAHIRSLDAVVVMSTVQQGFFEDHLDAERVHFVPHGIDTDYFRPLGAPTSRGDKLTCMTVGHHLRDYDLLARLAKRAAQENLPVEFNVVARPDRTRAVQGLDNVIMRSGISDEELLELYQTSDLLMLPLLDATANNTLLEGMACGMPVFSTDIQGVRDYAPAHCELVPLGDDAAMFECLRAAQRGEIALGPMRDASRLKAESLSWGASRQHLQTIYDAL
ncbi:MAG: glycosyltransferase [Pseudomonadota bacterium]